MNVNENGNQEETASQRISNYWDRGDKVGAQFFTRDMLSFLLPEIKIKEITFLDKEIVKEAFRSNITSDHVVKLILEDGSEIGVLQEFQHYHSQEIWERMWEYAVLLKRKHNLTIVPILVDYNKIGQRKNLEPVVWEKRPMLELGLENGTVAIDTFACMVFHINCMMDIEILTNDKPGLWTLLPFTKTQMTPAEMLGAILERLLELKVPEELVERVVNQLGYYLDGMYTPNELEEFNETLRRWEQMSMELKYVGRPWREEGELKKAREAIVEVLEERFGTVDSSLMEKLTAIEDLGLLTSLHRKSVKIASIEEFKKLL